VIGGLLAATFATLFLVPLVYSMLRRRAPRKDFLTDPTPVDSVATSTRE